MSDAFLQFWRNQALELSNKGNLSRGLKTPEDVGFGDCRMNARPPQL